MLAYQSYEPISNVKNHYENYHNSYFSAKIIYSTVVSMYVVNL